MRISDWSSDVCSSDLPDGEVRAPAAGARCEKLRLRRRFSGGKLFAASGDQLRRSLRCKQLSLHHPRHGLFRSCGRRSEEHTSELQSLMRISYAVFCLKKTRNNPSYALQNTKDVPYIQEQQVRE